MAVRFRKYYKDCRDIACNGKRSKVCPDLPKRANGEYKTCGAWCVEFFDDQRQWRSLSFKDVTNKTEAKERLALLIGDRESGQLNLPKKKTGG